MIGKAVILSAPSGSGKTTIVRHLLKRIPELSFSISATTRKIRPHEMNGRDYYFLSPEEFDQKIKSDHFLEWEEVYSGTKYGTLREEVERVWREGKSVVFDVDVVGGVNLKKELGTAALAIFVRVPTLDVLKARLELRKTESSKTLEERLSKAAFEMTYEGSFDATIINDDLEKAVDETEQVVREFLAK